jgi:hypothetical protein
MTDETSKELSAFAQCRQIMRAEDVPTGRLFAKPRTPNARNYDRSWRH